MLARGDSTGVFQFESPGMKEALRDIGPTEFEDLIAIVALYRPGPMQYIPTYARNKKDPASVVYDHEALRPILEPTHGVTIYQEQYMAIARRVGGFSPAQADDLRKAISKKNHQLMATLKEPLMEGLAEKGVPPAVANKMWANFEATGDYSFNKSHAACYAMISYRTAWLKANYPVEYMAALVSSVMNTKDKVPFYVNQCHEMGIEVLPPDVNTSDVEFTVVEGKIRFGMNAVKGVGVGAIEAIISGARGGRAVRVGLRLLRPRRLADGQQARARGAHPQRRLRQHRRPAPRHARGAPPGDVRRGAQAQGRGERPGRPLRHGRRPRTAAIRGPRCRRPSGTRRRCCASRRRPSACTSRPTRCRACASSCTTRSRSRSARLDDAGDGAITWTGGIVANAQKRVSKNGGVWLSFRLEDIDGGIECRAWPKVYEQYRELLVEDAIIKVKGRIERRAEGDIMLGGHRGRAVQRRERVPPAHRGHRLRVRGADGHRRPAPRAHATSPATVPVVLQMVRGEQRARLRVGDGLRVDPVAGLYAELKALLGESCIGVG